MQLFKTVAGLRCYLSQLRAGPQVVGAELELPRSAYAMESIGLVPTMGALHAGHLSLIQQARQDNDWVVVSIFVNPLQFAPHEDFQTYPRRLEQDAEICEQVGVDVVFAPSSEELYGSHSQPEQLTQVFPPASLLHELCGRSRPGHFPGVATVVTKLLNIVQPTRAYFGQKDAQQLAILQQLIADLNLPVELVACPIMREPDGLALSSRNQYLTPAQRQQASLLYQGLQQAERQFRAGARSAQDLMGAVQQTLQAEPAVQPEYIELVHPETLLPLQRVEESGLLAVAARIGSTRLIDNLLLRNRQPILAVDGPAGAGKSTVVRQVAQALELLYLDTGAMYRAVTWLVLESGIMVENEAAIAELVSQCQIQISGNPAMMRVVINQQDVTQQIRNPDVTAQVSAVSALSSVRREMVKRQQAYGRRGGIVMDGRDIGTHVFPDAELKIFLTASVQERARRRYQELKNQGQADVTLEALEQSIYERDLKDSTRRISPMRQAADAIEIQTDNLTIDQVVAKIVRLYQARVTDLGKAAPVLS
ncbi:MAG: bifunctional pantoate--beta-alanine ligase/(d)CMP kinase [Pegethrix bostrychoides GSE-TBD4-15B]|uniref:Bifunctional pantoate ligase/cytidylate kinase n=1 Tax=Pegethrix bostrychoides GSE-TBD4-15B TaxID=2839662 RepID=A0A951U369_9CYAN|nr:bifunctional pantoate--beta-alanine ligase/(d)CMP kinase [Pegethrix bostrychoides GSE-TBD4-15B]